MFIVPGCGTPGSALTESTQTATEPIPTQELEEPEKPREIEEDIVSLCEKYEDYFLIGAAVDARSYRDDHALLLKKHCNAIVCENEMKWESLQPQEETFRYTIPDNILDFAEVNTMMVRGHCLIWHNQTPRWVFRDSSNELVSKEVLIERIKNHITNVVTHCKGRVYAWDVVNEAIAGNTAGGSDAGEDLSQVESWGYRHSLWYRICGEDYIIEAFRAARAADPGAKLFYNDYWNYLDEKRSAIISLIVKKLQAEDLIDGIGLQGHLNSDVAREKMANQTVYQTVDNMEREIREYAALGLDVHITELDISIYRRDYTSSDKSRWYTDPELNEEMSDKLAARYREFFDMFCWNSDLISNVTFWGIAVDNTWLSEFRSGRPDHPLLFDKKLKAKKAFYAITDFE
jgi:endo-1,4-beta-xylanase